MLTINDFLIKDRTNFFKLFEGNLVRITLLKENLKMPRNYHITCRRMLNDSHETVTAS